ncbi:MAG: 1-deoxy-D-xylulose-5-phosphate reductoisomerase, partial [Oscillospiraceae bacterium]|nr:1-deoxy-D-xylulose-5-phosphate reductoisomerase [Oscillospiraceae bacterium]
RSSSVHLAQLFFRQKVARLVLCGRLIIIPVPDGIVLKPVAIHGDIHFIATEHSTLGPVAAEQVVLQRHLAASGGLANKESLVTGGKLVMDAVKRNNVKLLPVDSEHSAIFQCLQDKNSAPSLKKILLTASGGPFFGYTTQQLENVTKEQALKHPNWSMGSKITIDSATLMNKGLELIEAVWLFSVKPEDIQIVVHRQSIIHSAVEFADNSVIAQLGTPDMRIPIQYSLTYPQRMPSNAAGLDFFTVKDFTFAPADEDTFLCLKAAKEAIAKGGLYPCAVNGANERAVELFLQDKIAFVDIGKAVYGVLKALTLKDDYTLEDVMETDCMARKYVDSLFDI